ncbi:hypothetical protein RCH33_3203 [Flavobacterium daejeonense]|nr:hypothetical protein RCH33_3203 [Flavobacterium daejeonense]
MNLTAPQLPLNKTNNSQPTTETGLGVCYKSANEFQPSSITTKQDPQPTTEMKL